VPEFYARALVAIAKAATDTSLDSHIKTILLAFLQTAICEGGNAAVAREAL
jgi:hypothetical protein